MLFNYIVSIAPTTPTEKPINYVCRDLNEVNHAIQQYSGATMQISQLPVYNIVEDYED